MNGWKMDGLEDGRMNRWMDGRWMGGGRIAGGWMGDRLMDDGWVDGRMNEWMVDELTDA